jgi:hypothetical protein
MVKNETKKAEGRTEEVLQNSLKKRSGAINEYGSKRGKVVRGRNFF